MTHRRSRNARKEQVKKWSHKIPKRILKIREKAAKLEAKDKMKDAVTNSHASSL